MPPKTRAAAARKPRRKDKKNVTQGQAHIKSTFNNTLVTSTAPPGRGGARRQRTGHRSAPATCFPPFARVI
jgi:ribosomal protein S11